MDISGFMPHGHCILWNPTLLSIHVISDFLIFLSYCSIPLAIFYYIKRREIQNRVIPLLFISFILSCAVTHIFTIWNWWHANYWMSGFFKMVCAGVSSFTAVMLWILMPKALKIPMVEEVEELETKNRELIKVTEEDSTYFASVIHEIRNHLNVINLSSQTLLTQKSVEERDKKILKGMILRNGRVLNHLINDVLDLSKIRNGQFNLNWIGVDLDRLINEIEYEYELRSEEKGIEFVVEKNFASPMSIKIDPVRLSQVLRNLLSNAFKYTEKGHVKLIVEANPVGDDIDLKFEVHDTGSGIPDAQKERIFERFTRLEVHNKVEGVGVGLSLARGIAQLLGGELKLKTSSTAGSIFTVDIKTKVISKVVKKKAKKNKKATSNSTWVGRRLLIADDAKENRILYEIALKETGADLNFVENGLEAFSKAEKEDFDAVLLDIEMPVMDGRTAVKKIKAIKPSLTTLAVTGLSKGQEVEALLDDGFDDYVLKPIDIRNFSKVIQSHFD